MRTILVLVSLCFSLNLLVSQEAEYIMCNTEISDEDSDNDNQPCVEYFEYFYDYLDYVEIHKPVFHFVNYIYSVEGVDNNGVSFSVPAIQFKCIDDVDHLEYEDENNAFRIAKEILEWANRGASNVEISIPGNVGLPNNDLKIRYTDIVNCDDIVIVENGEAIQNVNGKLNVQIINTSNTSFGTMGLMGTNLMQLKNIGNKIAHPNKSFKSWIYGPLMNHEIGHDFGLCHAQAAGNLCEDVPNDEICESSVVDLSCKNAIIDCQASGKNNIMISGNASQRGFTPCQFSEAFLGMLRETAWRTTHLNDCSDIIIDKPQETTFINCRLYVCNRLIVRSGSELVLTGTLTMNKDAEIIVEQGARFRMEHGTIVGNKTIPGYWKGITLSDGYGAQVSTSTPISDYPLSAPSSFVTTNSGSGTFSKIENAKVAIATKSPFAGGIGETSSLIDMNWALVSNNETGMIINNYLNLRPINAVFEDTWFRYNVYDDLKIINATDIRLKKCFFGGNSEYGITLVNSAITDFNDCIIRDKDIGVDIKTTYPFHPGFDLGDDTGVSNQFLSNNISIQIGGGIGVGNAKDLKISRALFNNAGDIGIYVLGNVGYEFFKNSFGDVYVGVLSANSGMAENVIHCNSFVNSRDGFGIATAGNNRNLTMHSNEFDLSGYYSTSLWRLYGDLFQVQSAEFDPTLFNIALNPPAGNQFFDAGLDLNLSNDGNTVDYLIPQLGGPAQYYPQTVSNYNSVDSDPDIVDCPIDNNFTGGTGTVLTLPEYFIPNDSTHVWTDPIGDPEVLDEYLDYILNLPQGGGSDGANRTEIARTRFALYRWVLYMLAYPNDYDLSMLEDFIDSDYQRLLVGYYIHTGDAYNANRILDNLPSTDDLNLDFVTIQRVNLRRLFPAFYGISTYYMPTSSELQDLRTIAEKHSENTGYASALYYLYTNEKVYPVFDFRGSQLRSVQSNYKDDTEWLDIHPNPTDGSINLKSNKEISKYVLYDSYGRLQFTNDGNKAKTIILSMEDLSKGIYILNAKCGSKVITKKVVKI